MAKPEWGVKRSCPTTGQRFYDLNKDPIISPFTGEPIDVSAKDKTAEIKANLARAKKAEEASDDLVDDEDIPEDANDTASEDLVEETGDDDDADDLNSPSLSDEDSEEDEPVEFADDVLLADDDEDDGDMDDLGDVATGGDEET